LSFAAGEEFQAVGSEFPGWGDVPVEGLAGDAEFGAEVADLGVGLAHGGGVQAEFGGGHLEGSAAFAPAGAGGGQAGDGAFGDEFAFELARAAKMPKTSFPAAVVVSMAAPWPVSTFNPIPRAVRSWTVLTRWCRFRPSRSSFHTTRRPSFRSAFKQEASPGAVVGASGSVVFVELGGIDTGSEQGVALQGHGLRPVGFGHPHVADEHASLPSRIRSIK